MFSLAFLDVVSCGFGAIIILLIISQTSEPRGPEDRIADFSTEITRTQRELDAIRDEIGELRQLVDGEQRETFTLREEKQTLQQRFAHTEDAIDDTALELTATTRLSQNLAMVKQSLSEEMRRLQAVVEQPWVEESPIGGIPVDSEYIIFIIDTSGSMQSRAWPAVQQKMDEVLAIYPRVKGIQVLNDMGRYLFSQYEGRWIPDSPARRKAILKRLAGWRPFSNSSPVEGITAAIKTFYRPDRTISLYVFGDDFSSGSIQEVVETVERLNSLTDDGRKRVRVHTVGFPVHFSPEPSPNAVRFAALMRRLAEDNNGSFVGLSDL